MSSVVITNCIPELLALLGLASTDETRHVIMYVRFEVSAKRTLAITTDGRRLGVLDCGASLPRGTDAFAVHVPAAELAALLKAAHSLRPKTVAVSLCAENVRAEFDGCIISLAASPITYPPWRSVLDLSRDKPKFTAWNPELMNGFVGCDADGLICTTYGDHQQIFVLGESSRFFGVCMPKNINGEYPKLRQISHKVPAWIGGVA